MAVGQAIRDHSAAGRHGSRKRRLHSMPSQFSIVIIDPDKDSRDSITSTLRPYSDSITLAGSVDNLADGTLAIQKASPNVVILGVDNIEQGIKDVQHITTKHPRVSVIACSSEKN